MKSLVVLFGMLNVGADNAFIINKTHNPDV